MDSSQYFSSYYSSDFVRASLSNLRLQIERYFTAMNRRGMEMWQLLLILLAVILLLFFVAWYSALGSDLTNLFGKLGELF